MELGGPTIPCHFEKDEILVLGAGKKVKRGIGCLFREDFKSVPLENGMPQPDSVPLFATLSYADAFGRRYQVDTCYLIGPQNYDPAFEDPDHFEKIMSNSIRIENTHWNEKEIEN